MERMCGRYASIKAPVDLADEFRAVDATDGAAQVDYNVAPTKQIIAVVQRHPRDAEGGLTRTPSNAVAAGPLGSGAPLVQGLKGGARMINAGRRRPAASPRSAGR